MVGVKGGGGGRRRVLGVGGEEISGDGWVGGICGCLQGRRLHLVTSHFAR